MAVALAVDQDDRLWISQYNQLTCFHEGLWTYYDMNDFAGLRRILCLHCDSNGVLWIGTFENGLIRFDGENWAQYDIIPGIVTGVKDTMPHCMPLVQVSPNPFNPRTTISYTLPEAARIRLIVYSVTGQQVATLVDERQAAGTHNTVFDGKGLASGVYFYRCETPGAVRTGKMVLVR